MSDPLRLCGLPPGSSVRGFHIYTYIKLVFDYIIYCGASQVALVVKNLPANAGKT